jgi:hypothetical protein
MTVTLANNIIGIIVALGMLFCQAGQCKVSGLRPPHNNNGVHSPQKHCSTNRREREGSLLVKEQQSPELDIACDISKL